MGGFGHAELRGLAVAAGRFPDFKPLILCDAGRESIAQAAGFAAQAWPEFLLHGPVPGR